MRWPVDRLPLTSISPPTVVGTLLAVMVEPGTDVDGGPGGDP